MTATVEFDGNGDRILWNPGIEGVTRIEKGEKL
jgi:hypothetical protein